MTSKQTTTQIVAAAPGFRALDRDSEKGIVQGELIVAWEVCVEQNSDGTVTRRAHPITAGETAETEIPGVLEPDGRVTVFGVGTFPDLETAIAQRAFGALWF